MVDAGLSLLAQDFRDERNGAQNVEKNEHKYIPPKGMFSFDGTKIATGCAVNLHRAKRSSTRRLHCADNRQSGLHSGPAGQRHRTSHNH